MEEAAKASLFIWTRAYAAGEGEEAGVFWCVDGSPVCWDAMGIDIAVRKPSEPENEDERAVLHAQIALLAPLYGLWLAPDPWPYAVWLTPARNIAGAVIEASTGQVQGPAGQAIEVTPGEPLAVALRRFCLSTRHYVAPRGAAKVGMQGPQGPQGRPSQSLLALAPATPWWPAASPPSDMRPVVVLCAEGLVVGSYASQVEPHWWGNTRGSFALEDVTHWCEIPPLPGPEAT